MKAFVERRHLVLGNGRTVGIREARQDDRDRFIDFFAGLSAQSRDFMHGWSSPTACTPAFADRLTGKIGQADHRAIVAVSDETPERVVGYCWIDGLGVDDMPMLGIGIIDACHQGGLGSALLSLMLEWARDLGAEQVRLGVFSDNARGVHVYRKIGFTEDPTRPARDFDGRTEIYMVARTAGVPDRRFPLLELNGTPYAIGRSHGEAFGPKIRHAVSLLDRLLPLPAGEAEKQALLSLDYCSREAPELVEEVRGIADGAGLRFAQVFTLNASLDLLVSGAAAPDCWAAAIRAGQATKVLWTAEDSPHWRETCVLLHIRDGGGLPMLIWTFAGFVGRPGLNPGLALSAAAQSTRGFSVGMPYPFICRKALACASVPEAVSAISRYDRMRRMTYVLGDDTGCLARLETDARTATLAEDGGGPVFSSGRFAAERARRFGELLPDGDWVRLQRDHGPGHLCAHDASGLATLTCFQCDVPAGEMILTDGSACASPYLCYRV